MSTVKDCSLAPRYRADLFELMEREIGYRKDHLQRFEWREKELRKNNNTFIISKLVCPIERHQHFFEFNNIETNWKIRHTLGIPNRFKHHVALRWEQVVPYFQQWASDMFVELEGIERWDAFDSSPLQVPNVPNGSAPISSHEQKSIQTEIDNLALRIQQYTQSLTSQLKKQVHDVFEMLKRLLPKLDRTTWLQLFVTMATIIVPQLVVSYLNSEPLWYLFRDALNHIAALFF